jgi:hypothetical protein
VDDDNADFILRSKVVMLARDRDKPETPYYRNGQWHYATLILRLKNLDQCDSGSANTGEMNRTGPRIQRGNNGRLRSAS